MEFLKAGLLERARQFIEQMHDEDREKRST